MERFRLALPEDDLLSSSDNLRISNYRFTPGDEISVLDAEYP